MLYFTGELTELHSPPCEAPMLHLTRELTELTATLSTLPAAAAFSAAPCTSESETRVAGRQQ